jgi:hypothetical protein
MGEDVLGQGREDGLEVGTLGSLSHCDSMCSSRRQCSTKEIQKTSPINSPRRGAVVFGGFALFAVFVRIVLFLQTQRLGFFKLNTRSS